MECVSTRQRVYVTMALLDKRVRFPSAPKAVLVKDNVSVQISASVIMVGLVVAVRSRPVRIAITVPVMPPKHNIYVVVLTVL